MFLKAHIVFFFSGFAGLVYQILQMRQVGLLLGNTSQATAATLASYFLGLTVGSWFWGKRAHLSERPMILFSKLEGGIAISALLYFFIYWLFQTVYPSVYQSVGDTSALQLFKLLFSLLLVFPPAFFMGGTFPVMGEALVGTEKKFGKASALLYGVNILGATTGSFASAYVLIPNLGFSVSCAVNIGISCTLAGACWIIGQKSDPITRELKLEDSDASENAASAINYKGWNKVVIFMTCFVSGFGVLVLEVVWVRLFAQIHENSVYSFATVMIVVLLALGLGSLISSLLASKIRNPIWTLNILMLLSGSAVMISPLLLISVTDQLTSLSVFSTSGEYFRGLFIDVLKSAGVIAVILGMVFPFLMKVMESSSKPVGRTLGSLSAVNTLGAILGAVLCGFFFLEWFGMWMSFQVIATLYFVTGILGCIQGGERRIYYGIASVIGITLVYTQFSPAGFPVKSKNVQTENWNILETWEGSGSTVCALGSPDGHVSISINSSYTLGSTSSILEQVNQGRFPLELYPDTKSIFFLGMGTGSSAGSVLSDRYSVERVVVAELSPEVVKASKKYLTNISGRDFTFGLYQDPRAEVLVQDGRHHLMATDEKFDMINADLFLPYRSGAGSLYSLEHYRAAKERLNKGGVYVQWLPLFQLTHNEFGIIVKTMSEVFPQLTMWRSIVNPRREMLAIVGHLDSSPIPTSGLDGLEERIGVIEGVSATELPMLQIRPDPRVLLFFYLGNLTMGMDLFDSYPINSDDRPLIEYMAPNSLRKWENGILPSLMGEKIIKLLDDMNKENSVEKDPMLELWSDADRRLVKAGMAFHKASIYTLMQNFDLLMKNWEIFVEEWSNGQR